MKVILHATSIFISLSLNFHFRTTLAKCMAQECISTQGQEENRDLKPCVAENPASLPSYRPLLLQDLTFSVCNCLGTGTSIHELSGKDNERGKITQQQEQENNSSSKVTPCVLQKMECVCVFLMNIKGC